MESFVFKDKNNNAYLYSFRKKQLCFLNKGLYILVSNYLSGKTKEECIKYFENNYTYSNKNACINKFDFYIEYGYLDNDTSLEISTNLPSDSIKSNLGNVYNIVFEVTQKCNLRCFYCTYGELYTNIENEYNKELPPESAFALLDFLFSQICNDQCNSSYKRIITIGFYGGEPLLNFDLIKCIIEYIENSNINNCIIEYTMTTNGILLDRYMDYLIEKNFHLMISLDGDRDASIYRCPNGFDNQYDHILSNITKLKNKNTNYFRMNVSFNSVLHDKNSIASIMKFYRTYIGKTPKISELSNVSVSSSHVSIYKKISKKLVDEISLYRKELTKEENTLLNPELLYSQRFFTKLCGYDFKNLSQLTNELQNTIYLPTASCTPFSFKIFLSADGKLFLCEKIGYKYPIGHITNNKVIIDYDFLSNKYSYYYQKIHTECANCYDFYTCTCCLFEQNFSCKHMSKLKFKEKMEHYINLIINERY